MGWKKSSEVPRSRMNLGMNSLRFVAGGNLNCEGEVAGGHAQNCAGDRDSWPQGGHVGA